MTAWEAGEKLRHHSRGEAWGPGVPCADLTSLALSQSDSVGLHDQAEVIGDDVITESGVCSPFNIQKCRQTKTAFPNVTTTFVPGLQPDTLRPDRYGNWGQHEEKQSDNWSMVHLATLSWFYWLTCCLGSADWALIDCQLSLHCLVLDRCLELILSLIPWIIYLTGWLWTSFRFVMSPGDKRAFIFTRPVVRIKEGFKIPPQAYKCEVTGWPGCLGADHAVIMSPGHSLSPPPPRLVSCLSL